MKLITDITLTKRRFLLSLMPAFFCSNLFATTLKKYLKKPLQILFPIPYVGSIHRDIPMRMFESAGIDYYFENKFGASGLIASRYLKEDITGSTLMVATNTILLTNFIKNPNKVADDFEEVFKCVGMMYHSPMVLVTKSGGRFDTNFRDFVKRLRQLKSPATYSIYGYHDIIHLCGLMLSRALKIDLTEIPNKNSYLLPVLAGEVDFSFAPISAAIPFIKSSQLTAIAQSGEKPSELIPNVYQLSLMKEFYPLELVYGLVSSKNMSDETVLEINKLLNNVLSDEVFLQKQSGQGLTLFQRNSPTDYLNYLRSEKKKYEILLGDLK